MVEDAAEEEGALCTSIFKKSRCRQELPQARILPPPGATSGTHSPTARSYLRHAFSRSKDQYPHMMVF